MILSDSIKKTVALALLTAAATALGTKAVEYLFDKLKEKKDDSKDPPKKLILP